MTCAVLRAEGVPKPGPFRAENTARDGSAAVADIAEGHDDGRFRCVSAAHESVLPAYPEGAPHRFRTARADAHPSSAILMDKPSTDLAVAAPRTWSGLRNRS